MNLPRQLLQGDALAAMQHRPIGSAIRGCEHARQHTSPGPGCREIWRSAYHDGSLGIALTGWSMIERSANGKRRLLLRQILFGGFPFCCFIASRKILVKSFRAAGTAT